MIDAAWVLGGGEVLGNTGSGGYTTVAWVTGVGKGATIIPARGDTGKTLFVPNAGLRYTPNSASYHGMYGYLWSTIEDPTDASKAYRLYFDNGATSGGIHSVNKLDARSLRCVRS